MCHFTLLRSSLKLGKGLSQDRLPLPVQGETSRLTLRWGKRHRDKCVARVPQTPRGWGLQDLTSNDMSNEGNDQFLRLLPAPTKLEGAWTGAGCAAEAAFYCIKKECGWFPFGFWEHAIWLTCGSCGLNLGPWGFGWVLFSPCPPPSPGLQWEVIQVRREPIKKRLLSTNKPWHQREAWRGAKISESKALTHFCCTLCIARRPQVTVAPRGEMGIHPPTPTRGTLGSTPSQQRHFSVSSAAGREAVKVQVSSVFVLIPFCSSDMHQQMMTREALQSQGFFNDQSEGQPLTSPQGKQ